VRRKTVGTAGTLELVDRELKPDTKERLWLFRNPEALATVRRGLNEAARGKTKPLGSFANHTRKER